MGSSRWPMPRWSPRAPSTCPTTSPSRPNRCWSRRPGGWTQVGCGGSLGHLLQVADPDSAERDRERRHARRGLWLAPTFEGMVAVDGLLEPEAGQSLLAALEPLARPADAHDARSGPQRNADALAELARRALEGGRLPQAGGVRPQLSVIVDLDSLLGHPGAVGGEVGWAGPLDPEACRRLACDGAVTRVLVTRQHPGQHHPGDDPSGQALPATHDPNAEAPPEPHHPNGTDGLAARLRAATALLPPTLGGAPTQPLEVGRTTRVIQPAQRSRPGRPRRRLCLPPLPPTPGLVRSPSSAPLAPWRPHRPGEPGPAVPSPPPGRPRGRLAAHPRTRWPADRHPTASATSHRPATSPAPPKTGRQIGTSSLRRNSPTHRARQPHKAPEHAHDTGPGDCMGPEQPTDRARFLHGARWPRVPTHRATQRHTAQRPGPGPPGPAISAS